MAYEASAYCLLSAALSLVCSHVHCDLDAEHCEQVGSLPSHLIFLRLGRGRGHSIRIKYGDTE